MLIETDPFPLISHLMNSNLSIFFEDRTSQKNTKMIKILCYFGLFGSIK